MQFEHIGLITDQKKPGESFVPATRVWRTNYLEHPYRIEWLRFEPDSPVTTFRASRGIATSMLFKLCSRAPLTVMYFTLMSSLYAISPGRRSHLGHSTA